MMYFLDTNICAHILNGTYPNLNKRFFECNRSEIKIPSVVLFELFYGAEKSQKREQNLVKLQTFISEIEIIPFDVCAAEAAAQIRADLERSGTPIGGNNILIAATTLAHEGVLVTNNTREFSRIKRLSVEDWMQEQDSAAARPFPKPRSKKP